VFPTFLGKRLANVSGFKREKKDEAIADPVLKLILPDKKI